MQVSISESMVLRKDMFERCNESQLTAQKIIQSYTAAECVRPTIGQINNA